MNGNVWELLDGAIKIFIRKWTSSLFLRPYNFALLPQATSSNRRSIHPILTIPMSYLQTMALMVLGRQHLRMSQYVPLCLEACGLLNDTLSFLADSQRLN